jgi:hypothetical protein
MVLPIKNKVPVTTHLVPIVILPTIKDQFRFPQRVDCHLQTKKQNQSLFTTFPKECSQSKGGLLCCILEGCNVPGLGK